MEDKTDKGPEKPRKGVALQFLGVVCLSLGLLNSMLTLKAGLEPDAFIYILMIAGALLLGAGIWRSRQD